MENRVYKVGDIFPNIKTTKHITKEDIENKPGKTLVITGGDEKYGIFGFYDVSAINKGNCITFSRTSRNSFYRNCDFNGLDSVAALYHEKLTENISQYLITCFRKNSCEYSYNNKRLPEKLKVEEISLPSIIHEDGTYDPDWEYMENYIENLRKKIDIYTQDSIDIIENVKSHRNDKEIDTSEWKEYKNSDIFIMRGIKQSNRKADGIHKYASISQSSENNGASGWDSTYTELGNFISLEDNICGKCFYQGLPVFVSSSARDLHWMSLKSYTLTENIGLFLVPILNKQCYQYNRGNKRNHKKFMEESISLPSIIHEDGTYEPDWEYMEKYIEKLKEKKCLKEN